MVSDSLSLTIATPAVVLEAALPGAFDPPDVLVLAAVLTTLPELLLTRDPALLAPAALLPN
jgi:hypothetical protein